MYVHTIAQDPSSDRSIVIKFTRKRNFHLLSYLFLMGFLFCFHDFVHNKLLTVAHLWIEIGFKCFLLRLGLIHLFFFLHRDCEDRWNITQMVCQALLHDYDVFVIYLTKPPPRLLLKEQKTLSYSHSSIHENTIKDKIKLWSSSMTNKVSSKSTLHHPKCGRWEIKSCCHYILSVWNLYTRTTACESEDRWATKEGRLKH